MLQGSGRCHYHPDRAGLGVCVECRRVICRECTTQFEGINRCARCLEQRLQVLKGPAPRQDWTVGNVLLALTSAAVLFIGLRLLSVLVER
ncbi:MULTISPECIES: hypothetical protein [Stigmatella]|uniref:B box-type domain-containing protein n=2 Tax=Stigmatella TaxID=40 RepID=A0A1H7HXN0_STIAU|nr:MULTISPECIES: hypothetical protein [Stigmatella]SEK54898.1 hypothetical protein SAMN05444354_101850 [Stigmatella aurantiaca]SEU08299.1 hypothetical protein SAMN05443639_107188 [Stigmatella erecta]